MNQNYQVKILLCEDDLALARLFKKYMEDKGFVVDHARDGAEAYEKARVGGYSLVLMDIRMPRMDGLSVLQKLKDKPTDKKNGPIVMLTNLTEDALIKQAMSLGALSYMDKSNLDPNQLVEKITGVLGLPVQSN